VQPSQMRRLRKIQVRWARQACQPDRSFGLRDARGSWRDGGLSAIVIRYTPVRFAVQVAWTFLLPPRCCLSPGASSGSCRAPFARSVLERTARCEPPRLALHLVLRRCRLSPIRAIPFVPADSTAILPVRPHTVGTEVPPGCASRPSIDVPLQRSLPRSTRKSLASASKFHLRSLVPSSWFLTTSTVSSAAAVAGLLHPAADPGVHRVSGSRWPAIKPVVSRPPRHAGPAPRRIPLDSRSASPRSLPPCRSFSTTASMHAAPLPARCVNQGGRMAFADFEALLRLRVWCLASPLPAIGDPLLPGLRSSSRSLPKTAGVPSPTASPGFQPSPKGPPLPDSSVLHPVARPKPYTEHRPTAEAFVR
jgi:hypothetical protein